MFHLQPQYFNLIAEDEASRLEYYFLSRAKWIHSTQKFNINVRKTGRKRVTFRVKGMNYLVPILSRYVIISMEVTLVKKFNGCEIDQ